MHCRQLPKATRSAAIVKDNSDAERSEGSLDAGEHRNLICSDPRIWILYRSHNYFIFVLEDDAEKTMVSNTMVLHKMLDCKKVSSV